MLRIRFLLLLFPLLALPFTRSAAQAIPTLYPPDPSADIAWSAGTASVADIQAAFNNAHAQENAQLGTSIPMFELPTQADWDALSDNQKAFWLMNHERVYRGLAPWSDMDAKVIGVAQNYANFLMANDKWGHYEDGHNPNWRMMQVPEIAACWEATGENLAYFATSGSSIALPVERSVYAWLYRDSGSAWGHRHGILKDNFIDNSSPSGSEGFIGIGRASGPYQGWNFGELIVMDYFDPCATWAYTQPTFTISGRVTDKMGAGLPGATVSVSILTDAIGGPTDANGYFSYSGLTFDTWTVSVSKSGSTFIPSTRLVTVFAGDVSNVNFNEVAPIVADNAIYLPAILKNH